MKARPLTVLLILAYRVCTPMPFARAGDADSHEDGSWVLSPMPGQDLEALFEPGPDLPLELKLISVRAGPKTIVVEYGYATGETVSVIIGHNTRVQVVGAKNQGDHAVISELISDRAGKSGLKWTRLGTRKKSPLEPPGNAFNYNLAAGVALILFLVAGLAAIRLWSRRIRGSGDEKDILETRIGHGPKNDRARMLSMHLDPWNLAAAIFILCALLLRFYLASTEPISRDETFLLEPHFWNNWFLGGKTGENPLLFRFLVHLWRKGKEPLWWMRLWPCLFGGAGLWILFTALRKRTRPLTALAAVIVISLGALHLRFSTRERAYTLWFFFSLLAHVSYCKAVKGKTRAWLSFTLWSYLAVLSHFLALAQLLGYMVHSATMGRKKLNNLVVAVLPAVAAWSLLVAPIFIIQRSGSEMLRPSFHRFLLCMGSLLTPSLGGAAIVLLLLPLIGKAAPYERFKEVMRSGDGAVPWILLFSLAGVMLLSIFRQVGARHLFPVLPLAAMFGLSAMQSGTWSMMQKVLLGAVSLSILAGGAQLLLGKRSGAIGPAIRHCPTVLVSPPSYLWKVVYGIEGGRKLWSPSCKGIPYPPSFRDDKKKIYVSGIPLGESTSFMDAVLDKAGDFCVLDFALNLGSGAVGTWLEKRCTVTSNTQGFSHNGFTSYRCKGPRLNNRDLGCNPFETHHETEMQRN
ncbi:MAG: hypothetical protein GXP49_15245 [Deltaproteobacteria bacterium]|nr:hypothetical protein [Deltaproteobacteria bacterium]